MPLSKIAFIFQTNRYTVSLPVLSYCESGRIGHADTKLSPQQTKQKLRRTNDVANVVNVVKTYDEEEEDDEVANKVFKNGENRSNSTESTEDTVKASSKFETDDIKGSNKESPSKSHRDRPIVKNEILSPTVKQIHSSREHENISKQSILSPKINQSLKKSDNDVCKMPKNSSNEKILNNCSTDFDNGPKKSEETLKNCKNLIARELYENKTPESNDVVPKLSFSGEQPKILDQNDKAETRMLADATIEFNSEQINVSYKTKSETKHEKSIESKDASMKKYYDEYDSFIQLVSGEHQSPAKEQKTMECTESAIEKKMEDASNSIVNDSTTDSIIGDSGFVESNKNDASKQMKINNAAIKSSKKHKKSTSTSSSDRSSSSSYSSSESSSTSSSSSSTSSSSDSSSSESDSQTDDDSEKRNKHQKRRRKSSTNSSAANSSRSVSRSPCIQQPIKPTEKDIHDIMNKNKINEDKQTTLTYCTTESNFDFSIDANVTSTIDILVPKLEILDQYEHENEHAVEINENEIKHENFAAKTLKSLGINLTDDDDDSVLLLKVESFKNFMREKKKAKLAASEKLKTEENNLSIPNDYENGDHSKIVNNSGELIDEPDRKKISLTLKPTSTLLEPPKLHIASESKQQQQKEHHNSSESISSEQNKSFEQNEQHTTEIEKENQMVSRHKSSSSHRGRNEERRSRRSEERHSRRSAENRHRSSKHRSPKRSSHKRSSKERRYPSNDDRSHRRSRERQKRDNRRDRSPSPFNRSDRRYSISPRRHSSRERSPARGSPKTHRRRSISPLRRDSPHRTQRNRSISPGYRGERKRSYSPAPHRGDRNRSISPNRRRDVEKPYSPYYRQERRRSNSPIPRGPRTPPNTPPPCKTQSKFQSFS